MLRERVAPQSEVIRAIVSGYLLVHAVGPGGRGDGGRGDHRGVPGRPHRRGGRGERPGGEARHAGPDRQDGQGEVRDPMRNQRDGMQAD